MGCIIKYSYQLLFSLFALTHGQTLNFTVIGGYVNKTKTAQLNCQLSTALADVVDIFWNAKHAFNCVGGGCNPQLPSNYSDFSATQNDVAGTTVVTILNATKERDEVKWTCKYGTTLSADVNLTITCPASNSSRLIEESGYITLELICTCPYTSLDLTFYLGADSYTEVIPSKTVDKTACSSTYEASVNYTLILPLQHLKSYNGTFNVFVNNGFYTARFSGSRLYNFTAATTPPPADTTITMITESTTILTTKDQIGTTANITSTSSGTTANITRTSSGTTEYLTTTSCTPPDIVIIGVSVSGFLFFLVIIIIIICCCRVYCYRKERYISEQCENGTDLKPNYNETVTNYTAEEDATLNPAYGLSNILSVSSTSDEFPTKMPDLEKKKNSESEYNKLTQDAPFQSNMHASKEKNHTNTFNQDLKDKLISDKNELEESKMGKEEITNL